MSAPYLYALSLPERTVRSLSALSGGLLRELSKLALPESVREAALYRATAGIGLRFLIEQVGDVHGIYPRKDPLARKFVYRYATGTSIEMASILTLYVSPVWVLAALGDVTRAGKSVLSQIGDALKAEGLLEADVEYETMAQLLDGLERTSTHLALTVNMPPLDVPGLRREWEQFRKNLAVLPPARLPSSADVERAWNNLLATSRELHRSVFSVSAAMGMSALSAVPSHLQWLSRSALVAARTTGMVVGEAFLEHYAAASKELARTGFAAYCAKHSRPYLVAVIRNFLPEKKSWTERLLS
ncbi:MAG: hypothetical protein ABSB15_07545 [Bryobacteraceae bacterium]|jgi:hypothetical protein